MAVKTLPKFFRQADCANDPGPRLLGGCHRLLDGVQHELRWCVHPTGEAGEMGLVDGFETLFPTQIQRRSVASSSSGVLKDKLRVGRSGPKSM